MDPSNRFSRLLLSIIILQSQFCSSYIRNFLQIFLKWTHWTTDKLRQDHHQLHTTLKRSNHSYIYDSRTTKAPTQPQNKSQVYRRSNTKDSSKQGLSASNSPRTAASSSQARFSQQSQNQHSNSSHITGTSGHSQQSIAVGAQAPPGKVAIPALKTPRTAEPTKGLKQGQTSHACNYCRTAKAACTGGVPWRRFLNANTQCVYGDGKRIKGKESA